MIDMHEFSVINLSPPQPPRTAWPLWLCLLAGGTYLAFATFMAYLAVMWGTAQPLGVR